VPNENTETLETEHNLQFTKDEYEALIQTKQVTHFAVVTLQRPRCDSKSVKKYINNVTASKQVIRINNK